jgi:quinol monooxygenase YgiN
MGVKEVKWADMDKFDRHQFTDHFWTVINMVRKFMFYKITEISEHLRKS